MKWEKKKIEDICLNITSGGTPKSTNEAFYNPQEIPPRECWRYPRKASDSLWLP